MGGIPRESNIPIESTSGGGLKDLPIELWPDPRLISEHEPLQDRILRDALRRRGKAGINILDLPPNIPDVQTGTDYVERHGTIYRTQEREHLQPLPPASTPTRNILDLLSRLNTGIVPPSIAPRSIAPEGELLPPEYIEDLLRRFMRPTI